MNLIRTIEKIKTFEGFVPYVYYDLATKSNPKKGTATIGYGFTDKNLIKKGRITKEEADKILTVKVIDTYEAVCIYMSKKKYSCNLNQLCALTDFAYNLGMGNLYKLTGYGLRSMDTIGKKIKLYNKAGGKVLNGLVKRRKWEEDVFYGRIS